MKLTHDVYENTWKCGELKLFFPHPPEDKQKTKSASMRSSAGCRYSAGISHYSAHTGTIEQPPLLWRWFWHSVVVVYRYGVVFGL